VDQLLNALDLLFLKIGLPALAADPGSNILECDVTALAVNMKRGRASGHLSSAMHAFHDRTLTRVRKGDMEIFEIGR